MLTTVSLNVTICRAMPTPGTQKHARSSAQSASNVPHYVRPSCHSAARPSLMSAVNSAYFALKGGSGSESSS